MKTRALVLLALLCFLPLLAYAAPAISISVSPNTGVVPYQSTLTWTVTGATGCTAADGWTGTQSLSGSKSVSITAPTKFTLTCTAADGQVTTVITPPTTNTDGTPLTDLAGFNIYRGTSATNLAKVKALGPTVLTYQATGLPTGTYYIATTAVNGASIESAQGNTAPFPINVTGSTASASALAAVQSVPNAPTSQSTTVSVTTQISVTTGQ